MIVPLLFNIDLLLFTRMAVGKAGGEVLNLPCRAIIAIAKKDSWMYGITVWIDTGGAYGGEDKQK